MLLPLLAAAGLALFCMALAVIVKARRRNVHLWLPAYARGDWTGRRERRRRSAGPTHVMFCIADHFEPGLGGAPPEHQRERVSHWMARYPELAEQFADSDGRPPRHTFFYPAEQYEPEHLDRLAGLAAAGLGEVEVHLHHDGDTADGLAQKLGTFAEQLLAHGHLSRWPETGGPAFGFVHGNWALDNSRPDGRWCGVNNELQVLRRCGCYADLTFPSAPSPTQPRLINSIYYATDDPDRPRSFDSGEPVRSGATPSGDLMLIQGPLGWTWRPGRLLPRIEAGDLAAGSPPAPRRAAMWVRTGICVGGRPDWVFVKVHTHGCKEANWQALFGPPMLGLHACLGKRYNDGQAFRLHYVTAREMYNIVKAAERGLEGDPGQFRDLVLPPPAASAGNAASERTKGPDG